MHLDLRRFFENNDIREPFEYNFKSNDSFVSSDIHVSGVVNNTAGIVSVSANADLCITVHCARCAKEIQKKLSVPVKHYLIAHLNNEDNDEYILVEDMELDLDRLVMEDIYLTLPSRFLCKPDCKGLCPVCGKDLNDGECGCKKATDPRLAVLQSLLSDEKQ
ncbi:MAG: DUF177 domain-containing protein [Clostridiales bacterium]|nr:DUF177 domain-containing protein [Clostridiales bacterium]